MQTIKLGGVQINQFTALIALVGVSYVANMVVDGSGGVIMAGAFALWFIAGDGSQQLRIVWQKFVGFVTV